MRKLKTLAGIILSASLMACGSGVGGQLCQRAYECSMEVTGEAMGTVAECVAEFNDGTSGYTADQMAILNAAINVCLAKATCEEFAECIQSFAN